MGLNPGLKPLNPRPYLLVEALSRRAEIQIPQSLFLLNVYKHIDC
jgi:hypothetical protein